MYILHLVLISQIRFSQTWTHSQYVCGVDIELRKPDKHDSIQCLFTAAFVSFVKRNGNRGCSWTSPQVTARFLHCSRAGQWEIPQQEVYEPVVAVGYSRHQWHHAAEAGASCPVQRCCVSNLPSITLPGPARRQTMLRQRMGNAIK